MNVLVVGSLNVDSTVLVDEFPAPGETLLALSFRRSQGGKGANQAVALARVGVSTAMIGRVGQDSDGDFLLSQLRSSGVNTSYIARTADAPSGVALISVDKAARNTIVVAAGANYALTPSDIDASPDAFRQADAVLLQLEIPLDVVRHALQTARQLGCMTVLNPAPYQPLAEDILSQVDIFIPNEVEFAQCAGLPLGAVVKNPALLGPVCSELAQRHGLKTILVTLGERGCYAFHEMRGSLHSPYNVRAVDTTAAGDSFIGGFLRAYLETRNLPEAIDFGQKVAAIAVSRQGAADSIPTYSEVMAVELVRHAG